MKPLAVERHRRDCHQHHLCATSADPTTRSYGMDMSYVAVTGAWLRSVLPAPQAPSAESNSRSQLITWQICGSHPRVAISQRTHTGPGDEEIPHLQRAPSGNPYHRR